MNRPRNMFALMCAAVLGCAILPASAQQTAPSEPPTLPTLPERQPPTVLSASTQGEIRFDTRTPFDFDVLLTQLEKAPLNSGKGTLFLPTTASAANPVAALVLLPGSGGISPGREMEYGRKFADQGYAAIVIDYYSARGYTPEAPYRDKTSGVTEFDIVADAYGALRALAGHPAIDARRIGVIGYSYGGMAVRLAMDARVREQLAPDLPPFAAHIDFYGPCFQDFGTQRSTGAPLLSLRGGEDASNDLVACAKVESDLRAAGSAVGTVVYATAGHAWEVDRPRGPNQFPYVAGCTMVFDAQGLPSVNGRQMIAPATDPQRAARHALRWGSGDFFKGCLKVGYIVGRDDAVKEQSDQHMLHFLARTLAQ